jgi:CRP-like cAMP-binding protein
MNMVRKPFKKGEVIFDISEKSDDLYLIDLGTVQIESSEGMVLAALAKGEMFGEMASILGERERTVRAVALETAVIDVIDSKTMRRRLG